MISKNYKIWWRDLKHNTEYQHQKSPQLEHIQKTGLAGVENQPQLFFSNLTPLQQEI